MSPSPYPQAFLVNLARRSIAEALVLAFVIVEAQPSANAGLRLGDRRIGMEVDLLWTALVMLRDIAWQEAGYCGFDEPDKLHHTATLVSQM